MGNPAADRKARGQKTLAALFAAAAFVNCMHLILTRHAGKSKTKTERAFLSKQIRETLREPKQKHKIDAILKQFPGLDGLDAVCKDPILNAVRNTSTAPKQVLQECSRQTGCENQ